MSNKRKNWNAAKPRRAAIEEIPEFRKLVGDSKFVPLSESDCATDFDKDVDWLLRLHAATDRRNSSEIRVLDFGCGRGKLVGQLRWRGFRAFGVDIDSRFIEFGSVLNRYVEEQFSVLSVTDNQSRTAFPDAYFDIIISDQVIEHANNLPQVAAEMARLLAPGGFLLLIFPAKYRPVECHYFLPLVHWLPKSELRRVAIWALVSAGLGVTFNCQMSSRLKADTIYKFSVEHTFYRPRLEIADEFAKVGVRLDFDALPRAKLERKLSHAGRLGNALASVVRWIPATDWYTLFRACLPVGVKGGANVVPQPVEPAA